jgi:glutaredoxin-related protein
MAFVSDCVLHCAMDTANGGAIQAALLDMTLQRTVPNVWIKNTFVGGSDGMFINRRQRGS